MQLPSSDSDWFVIRAKAGWEHLAAAELREGGFETYLPMRRIRNIPSRFRRMRLSQSVDKHEAVMPGYLFVASPAGRTVDWGRFRDDLRFRHVGRPLRSSEGVPHRISAKWVIAISVNETNGVYDETGAHDKLAERFAKGREFVVKEGPFASFNAAVDCVTSSELVRVLVNIFGRDTVVTLDPSQLDEVA